MNGNGLQSRWDLLRAQWLTNLRLRAGVWVILGIVCVYGLLLLGDATERWRMATQQVVDDLERLRPLGRAGNPWPDRVDEARRQLTALRAMQWNEGEVGLVEAAFQDWVRAVAAKTGLRVRELSLARAAPSPGPAVGASGIATDSGANGQPVMLRMRVEFGRNELLAFLAEVGRQERVIVVERLLLRPAASQGSAELDLRISAQVAGTPAGGEPAR